jgi:hypothetical protein
MFKVKKERCDQCLFGENKIVSNKRRKEILKGCVENDNHFICHKASIEGENTCCSGFYETQTSNMIRISQRMGFIELVD